MNQSTIARLASAAFLVLTILLSGISRADSPLPPPEKKTVWSANRQFFAVMEPDNQITTVYRKAQGKPDEKVWSMYGWFRVASLTDDGERLIAGYGGMNVIPLEYDKKLVMLYFFKRGELINYVTLDQIIHDTSSLRRTVSHYAWGNFEGLDPEGRYVVETVEGRRIRFDVAKGMPVVERDGQIPPRKSLPPRR
jgi:hypothetical protein